MNIIKDLCRRCFAPPPSAAAFTDARTHSGVSRCHSLLVYYLFNCLYCLWLIFFSGSSNLYWAGGLQEKTWRIHLSIVSRGSHTALHVTKTWVWHDRDVLDECENVRAGAVCLDWVWSKHDVLFFFFLGQSLGTVCQEQTEHMDRQYVCLFIIAKKKNMAYPNVWEEKTDNGWDAQSKRVWIQVGTLCACGRLLLASSRRGSSSAGVWRDEDLLHHKVNYQSNKEPWARQLCSLRDSVEGGLGCSLVQFQSIHLLPALRVEPQLSQGEGGVPPWTSHLFISGPTQTTVHTHTRTYRQFRAATSLDSGRLVQFQPLRVTTCMNLAL